MEFGRYPSGRVLQMLSARLKSLVEGKPLHNGNLYTFTVISRTLFRAGYPIEEFPRLLSTWEEAFQRKVKSPQLDMDYIWLLQMIVEMWPDVASKKSKHFQTLLDSTDARLIFPTMAMLLFQKLGIEVPCGAQSEVSTRWWRLIESDAFDESTDWHISYAIMALLAAGELEKAVACGSRLCTHQVRGGWDESSPECIESTSLCGLAMLDLSTAVMNAKSGSSARNAAALQVVKLMDQHNWLLHWWWSILRMPRTQSRGWAFESFVREWVSLENSMTVFNRNVRGGTDEIDIVVQLQRDSPLSDLLGPGQFILVECKHTSKPIGAKEIRSFRDILKDRTSNNFGLGVFLSTGGFTEDASQVSARDYSLDQMVLLLSGEEVEVGLKKRIELSTLLRDKLTDIRMRIPKS